MSKTKKIRNTTFKFDGDKIKYKLAYQGNKTDPDGKAYLAPDKRYDENCEGLCMFIYPSETKVFYAYKRREMFNRKKNRLEKNCFYKKLHKYQDVKGYKYRDAKDKLAAALEQLKNPVPKDSPNKLAKDLFKQFLREGMEGDRIDGKFKYKDSSKKKYKQYINAFLLLKHKTKSSIKKLTEPKMYKQRMSTKPVGEYSCSELSDWHMNVLYERLKDTPTTANGVVNMVSTIFAWAIKNEIYKGTNPCDKFIWKHPNPIKAKLLDSDTAKLKKHIKGKAFDYEPHFLTCVGLHLFLGCRSTDIFGLRWEAPLSEEEKLACSGWLLDGWETADKPKFHLWNMKNRKGKNKHLDQESLVLLKRLKEAKMRDRNSWSIKSVFVLPQKWDITKHAVYGSYDRRLRKLNQTLGFERLEGDNVSRIKGKRKIFSFKIARKTFGTEIARNKGGIELAAIKLDHTNPSTTRKSYIVPDNKEEEIENLYEKNLPDNDVIVVEKDKKSVWYKK